MKTKIFPPQATGILPTINFPIHKDVKPITIGNAVVVVTQIPVRNSNVSTTGHKLQGMSKNALIVNSWEYRFENWVDVILSRVYTHPKRTLPCSAPRFGEGFQFQCTSETP